MLVFYKKDTGVIFQVVDTSNENEDIKNYQELFGNDVGILIAPTRLAALDNCYVIDAHKTMYDKKEMRILLNKQGLKADGEDVIVFSNIPEGTIVLWPDGIEIEMNEETTVEFAVDLPGKHTFKFFHPHYFDKEVTCEAYP